MSPTDALALRGISKAFPGVQALKGVDFAVRPGEIHGLVGENGAGKSTLVAIAAGVLRPDAGTVEIDGTPLLGTSPQGVRRLGVSIVRQEPALLPDLTVGENLYIGVSEKQRPRLGEVRSWAWPLLDTWGVGRVDPTVRTDGLGANARFVVEITKALAGIPRVLILDEPTEHLDADDVDILFQRVRQGARKGWAVVYISHRIAEVKQIADRITVLRDGESRGTFESGALSETEIINLIVGRPVETAFPPKANSSRSDQAVLEVSHLNGAGFTDISLTVAPGEVVGFAGIDGNGQREAARAVAGLEPSTGSILLRSAEIPNGRPDLARKAGVVYIPRERHTESLFKGLVVRENLVAGALPALARMGLVRKAIERARSLQLIGAFGIRTGSSETAIETLSGGNQQKVVLARTIGSEANLLLADGPTQGVDAGARVEIYRLIKEFADNGGSAVVVSSDGIELAGLCDRVLVFSRGTVVETLAGEQLTERGITSAALTAATKTRLQGGSSTTARRIVGGDWAPSIALGFATFILGFAAALANDRYLTGLNFRGMLALLATLVFVAFGQQIVMMTGGIDLSVGPLMGFLVIVASFFITSEDPVGPIWVGWLLMVGAALVVGLINWCLIDVAGLHPVVATLVTFMALRGISLILRPVPGGLIDTDVTDRITARVGFLPIGILFGLAIAGILEYALRRTWFGVATRATGSDSTTARDLGVPVKAVRLLSYLACSLLAWLAAVLLMAQIGSGNPGAGVDYTLTSIAAVVLGGTSIFGGRGSFVGTFMGALLLQQIVVATAFLGLGEEWRYYLLGALTLLAVATYSRVRSVPA